LTRRNPRGQYAADTEPYVAADRLTLFFMSNRPGGCGGFDQYMATRIRLADPDKE
jgi:hypothetical protein